MKKVKAQLGEEVCRNLLFLHFINGCDTTSRLYAVGKETAFKRFENALHFKEQANVISCHSAVSDVVNRGEKAPVSLFCGEAGVGLNALRYQRSLKTLQPGRLILSHRGCGHQGKLISQSRVYLQVKHGQGEGFGMSTEVWEWKITTTSSS